MHRRIFLLTAALSLMPAVAFAKNRKFVFKIKTKSGGIVGNIVIEAKDIEAAKHILRERYLGCEILEASEK